MVIKVPIVTTYNNTGTKRATQDVKGLDKTLKKFGLASKLSYAAAGAAVTAFAKKSIMAAAADDKAQRSLANTLKNVGQSYQGINVENFIKQTSLATGILDDQLRPAFQKLVTATGDATKSQELLDLALNISAGTGKDLNTVVAALSRGVLGQNTALGRLGVGLTKTELKTLSFAEITDKLSGTFSGQAQTAADSYAGQLARVGVAAAEASETIGTALFEAFNRIAGEGGISSATDAMGDFAEKTANVITGISVIIEKLKGITGPLDALNNKVSNNKFLKFFTDLINPAERVKRLFRDLEKLGAEANESVSVPTIASVEREALNASKKAAELAKKAAEEKAKELAKQRQLTANKKLAAKFDQQNIAIEAALKGKLSEEDRARLLAMKALKSESKADDSKALEELEAQQKKAAAAELARIKEIEAANAAAYSNRKSEIKALQEWLASNPLRAYIDVIGPSGKPVTVPRDFGAPPMSNAAPTPPVTNATAGIPTGTGTVATGGGNNITVNVNAGTVADENKLTYIIADQIVKYVRFGGVTAPAGFI